MTEIKYIDADLLKVYKFGEKRDPENLLTTLFWGDNVKVIEKSGDVWKLDFSRQVWNQETNKPEWKQIYGQIPDKTRFLDKPLLKIRFVDCGQGDASVIESPKGKIVFLDGGENLDLTHYVSSAWAHILRSKPLKTEAIVVTHGDADHFSGLTKLLQRTRGNKEPILSIKRVYHNGLVKAPDSVAKANTFGATKKKGDATYITDLVEDVRTTPDDRLNTPFKEWKETLNTLTQKKPDIEMKRITFGDNNSFNFFEDEGIKIQVLGPIVDDVNGSPALRYFQGPKGGLLPSETINGHSIVLKLTYGNVRFLFGADLNAESEATLLKQTREAGISLAAEILKVPHHGSADFDPEMLKAVSPTVSVISSGDESESTEYIHPRAGLVGALGKYSNPDVERPLIYVTEMVAFFKRIGRAQIVRLDAKNKKDKEPFTVTNAYNKTVFGIVHVRTDGKRVLVVTHSGTPNKESYAFTVDEQGKIEFDEKTRIL